MSRGGQILRRLAGDVGLDVQAGTWLNAVACATESPDPHHLDSCRGNLIGGLHAANTRFVLLCGAVAVGSWRPDVKVSKVRGRWFIWWGEDGRGWWVLPTYHPAAILKRPSLRDELRDDLATFVAAVNDPTVPPTPSLICVECDKAMARWDADGVGWCEECWKKTTAVKLNTSRRHRLSPDQGAFKF